MLVGYARVSTRDQAPELQRHMDARRLISNVIVYWNTRYIAHALETLERQGHTVRDDDVRHIHPVHFEHINPFGHYRFDTRRGPAKGRFAHCAPRPTPRARPQRLTQRRLTHSVAEPELRALADTRKIPGN